MLPGRGWGAGGGLRPDGAAAVAAAVDGKAALPPLAQPGGDQAAAAGPVQAPAQASSKEKQFALESRGGHQQGGWLDHGARKVVRSRSDRSACVLADGTGLAGGLEGALEDVGRADDSRVLPAKRDGQ
ncbi:unnamed protein product [Prorocentrum cordatum]|uniref:Uncharacterized protein n=1 Tax=Prorocentrum cordatum TaxID=2364126 RepID=A0ABN9V0J8_9DINO|nr:unnamed protein product [Polarella glacialis]